MAEDFVEAIEDGKIVRVSKEYALKEGLLILRRPKIDLAEGQPKIKKRDPDEGRLSFDDYRRPLKNPKNRVIADLVENFHWEVSRARRAKNMNRKQLAKEIGVNETEVKLLENGILEKDDFVLINKVQEYFGINLRKDKKDFNQEMRKLVEEQQKKTEAERARLRTMMEQKKESDESGLSGEDIEIID